MFCMQNKHTTVAGEKMARENYHGIVDHELAKFPLFVAATMRHGRALCHASSSTVRSHRLD